MPAAGKYAWGKEEKKKKEMDYSLQKPNLNLAPETQQEY